MASVRPPAGSRSRRPTRTNLVALEPGDALAARTDPAAAGHTLRVVIQSPVARPSTVDEWGRDPKFVAALTRVARVRWDIRISGADLLPAAAALIVVNTRRMALTPVSSALALSASLGRPVRFVGRPDTVPLGPLLRRLGGLLAHPDEIRSALREGELVVLGSEATTDSRHAGVVDHTLVAAAVRERASVHVAATVTSRWARTATVDVSSALRPARSRRGPLAEVELAEQAQRRLQRLLDHPGGEAAARPQSAAS